MDLDRIEALVSCEFERFSVNDYRGMPGEPEFALSTGGIPVMISAPHAVTHVRNGAIKPSEDYTGSIAIAVAHACNCHAIVATRTGDGDPNWDPLENSAYKQALCDHVRAHKIEFVLDLHGMIAASPALVAVGSADGETVELRRAADAAASEYDDAAEAWQVPNVAASAHSNAAQAWPALGLAESTHDDAAEAWQVPNVAASAHSDAAQAWPALGLAESTHDDAAEAWPAPGLGESTHDDAAEAWPAPSVAESAHDDIAETRLTRRTSDTAKGESAYETPGLDVQTAELLRAHLARWCEQFDKPIVLNGRYGARGFNTIARTVARECLIPALQVEIATQLRVPARKIGPIPKHDPPPFTGKQLPTEIAARRSAEPAAVLATIDALCDILQQAARTSHAS